MSVAVARWQETVHVLVKVTGAPEDIAERSLLQARGDLDEAIMKVTEGEWVVASLPEPSCQACFDSTAIALPACGHALCEDW